MSPENIPPGSNIWKMFDDEYFETTRGEKIEGPLIGRIETFEDLNLLTVQAVERKYEVQGTDFESAVKKKSK